MCHNSIRSICAVSSRDHVFCSGETIARHRELNMRLILRLTKEHCPMCLNVMAIIQAGMVATMRAAMGWTTIKRSLQRAKCGRSVNAEIRTNSGRGGRVLGSKPEMNLGRTGPRIRSGPVARLPRRPSRSTRRGGDYNLGSAACNGPDLFCVGSQLLTRL